MDAYLAVKWLHILSATVLFGTGVGSAFYLFTAVLTRDTAAIAHVARWVVRADWMFTATTALLQPFTGWWMLHRAGLRSPRRGWRGQWRFTRWPSRAGFPWWFCKSACAMRRLRRSSQRRSCLLCSGGISECG